MRSFAPNPRLARQASARPTSHIVNQPDKFGSGRPEKPIRNGSSSSRPPLPKPSTSLHRSNSPAPVFRGPYMDSLSTASELTIAEGTGATFTVCVGKYQDPSEYFTIDKQVISALGDEDQWQRKTKVVATIGPATATKEGIQSLAAAGINVCRLNFSHGTHEWHKSVVDIIRAYNAENPLAPLGILLDTKGPEVRSGDVQEPIELHRGDLFTFTIEPPTEERKHDKHRTTVNYDAFPADVSEGDVVLVDGGIMSLRVVETSRTEVKCRVIEGGVLSSRRHLNVRGKSASLPSITDRDWLDIKFGVENNVDFYALSFVKDAAVIRELKDYLKKNGAARIQVLAKIESAEAVQNLEEILDVVDGAMVARGDLGAELPVEEVPFYQSRIVQGCRERGKPVIVATNMLESMIQNPTPTPAEVSDISIAVREGADAVMLSGETAYGQFPFKSVQIMSSVAARTEIAMLSYSGTRRHGSDESKPINWIQPPLWRGNRLANDAIPEMFAYHATSMANTLKCPLVVFSRAGNMARFLSHYRPDRPIYAFTESESVQSSLSLYYGVYCVRMQFEADQDPTFDKAFRILVENNCLIPGQMVLIASAASPPIFTGASTNTIQVRVIPSYPDLMSSGSMDMMKGSMLDGI